MKLSRRSIVLFLMFVFVAGAFLLYSGTKIQGALPFPEVSVNIGSPSPDETDAGMTTNYLQLLFLVAIVSLAPSILMVMTSFTRIIIVLHFLRSALGTQQMPPNQILVGLALFLTVFLMSPTIDTINATALQPLSRGEITQEAAIDNALVPIREYMFRQVTTKDLALFSRVSGTTYTNAEGEALLAQVPTTVLIPAYILSELKTGFTLGFYLYLPFIVIDMVVASVLMAMGMMMLPPAMISLPFKILVFIMIDGWGLLIESLFRTFR